MKNNFDIKYNFIVQKLVEGDEIGYKAVIPAFNGIVYADTLDEMEEAVYQTIEDVIEHRRKNGIPIPKPDRITKYSGKFMLRIEPELHEKLALSAKAKNKSLNQYIRDKIAV